MLQALYFWGKRLRYKLDMRLGGPQSRPGLKIEEKNLFEIKIGKFHIFITALVNDFMKFVTEETKPR
jgi:hypothetical protein